MARREDDTVGQLTIGDGQPIKKLMRYSVALDPANPGAAGVQEDSVTCTGVKAGDIVLAVNKPTLTTAITVTGARVSADNTVMVQFVATAAATTGSETYQIVVGRF